MTSMRIATMSCCKWIHGCIALAALVSCSPTAQHIDQLAKAEAGLQEQFSGVVLATLGEKTVFAQAFGYADRQKKIANRFEHRFRVGSLTKTFTAAMIHKLVDDGQMSLDEPIDEYVTGLPNGNDITLRMLIDHTSGLRDWRQRDWKTLLLPETALDDDAVLAMIREKSAKRLPGRRFEYNNIGYMLLGYAIEKAAEDSYGNVLRQHLLEPLGLQDTGVAALDSEIAMIAHGQNSRRKSDETTYDHRSIRAAGGMYSTAGDMIQWCRALLTPGLLSPVYQDELPGWRTGSRFGRRAYWHSGNTNTFSALLVLFPEVQGCYVALSNLGRKKPPTAILKTIPAAIFGAGNDT